MIAAPCCSRNQTRKLRDYGQPCREVMSHDRGRRQHARGTDAREDSADRARLLGVEDVAERHRDGRVHRAGAWRRTVRHAERTAGPAPALGARLPRRARRARLPHAQRGLLRQHARDGPVSRQGQAVVSRRHPGDGQPSPLSVLGPPDRSPADGHATKRSRRAAVPASSRRSTPIRRACSSSWPP